jgi:regulator of replication initiation timing
LIRQNAKEIKKLLNYKWEYYKINKKVKKLQVIAQGYVRQMDSLYTENKILKEENIQITRKYNKQVAKTNELETMRERLEEKVSQAEVLQTYNLKAEGLQVKYGGSKQKQTDKAKRVNKIKLCFTLSENLILPTGDKKLYIRIARPDKLILTPSRGDDYSFDYQGEKLQYSIMKEIYYEGLAQDICLYWSKKSVKEEMSPGTYQVEVFEGDNVIGHTNFSLR